MAPGVTIGAPGGAWPYWGSVQNGTAGVASGTKAGRRGAAVHCRGPCNCGRLLSFAAAPPALPKAVFDDATELWRAAREGGIQPRPRVQTARGGTLRVRGICSQPTEGK